VLGLAGQVITSVALVAGVELVCAMTVFTDQFLVLLQVLGCGQSLECWFVLEVGDVHVHFPGFHDCWAPLYLPLELFTSEVPDLFACSRVLCPSVSSVLGLL
jgi:hypothetical protein